MEKSSNSVDSFNLLSFTPIFYLMRIFSLWDIGDETMLFAVEIYEYEST